MALDTMTDPVDLEALRTAWAAANQTAIDALATELAAALTPEEIYAAHARFVRATAAGFSEQMEDVAALLRTLAGLK